MKKTILTLSLFALSTLSFATGNVNVRSFTIEGLKRYAGKSATIFYVSGRSTGFSVPGARPRIRKVLKKVGPLSVKSSGEVSVPSTGLVETGWEKYNFIGVIVHEKSQRNVALKNLDGSVPSGQTNTSDSGSYKQIKSYFVPKMKINGRPLKLR
jgi:hypothetical protein